MDLLSIKIQKFFNIHCTFQTFFSVPRFLTHCLLVLALQIMIVLTEKKKRMNLPGYPSNFTGSSQAHLKFVTRFINASSQAGCIEDSYSQNRFLSKTSV